MRQLQFAFISEPETATSPRPSYWKRRLKRTAEQSYYLGRMRRQRAESVAGELLKQMDKAKPNPAGANQYTKGKEVRSQNATEPKTLADLGITKQQSADWQKPPPVYLNREERNSLSDFAARLERLTISRTNPHEFFEQRSEIAAELRAIAKRS
jgi:hypothetical protein